MIVLLTDFGESEYVGMMKGVIYSLCEKVRVVDLTHSISPQCVIEGAWVLLQSYKYFPHGAIFVAVVDPEVGTARDGVLVRTKNYTFIGPDNGLLYPAATEDGIKQIFTIRVTESDARTFHGRDVFARAAAYLYAGAPGRQLDEYKPALSQTLTFHLKGREGQVVRVDSFGNIITNIPPLDKKSYTLRIGDFSREMEWVPTYAQGPKNELFLITGSAGTLEISMRNASAVKTIAVTPGDIVTIE